MKKYYEAYQEVKEILKKSREYRKQGKTKEDYDFLSNEQKQYPNNYCLKSRLMEASHALSYCDIDNEQYIEETILLANDILNNYEFGVNHYLAIRLLAIQYRRIGKQEEIIEKVRELPSIWESKTLLMPEVLKGEERIKAVQSNIYLLVDIFDSLLLSTYGREEV